MPTIAVTGLSGYAANASEEENEKPPNKPAKTTHDTLKLFASIFIASPP
jgi:hypothetical protein